tara:strand:- start:1178 stop:2311 length:1134 start_codon:yes stop_codon:yes gene_type:complete
MERNYDGILLEQRPNNNPIKCFTYITTVKELLEYCTVARQNDGQETGYQRIIKPAKVKAISKFMEINEYNIIPNSLIIAFGKEFNYTISSSNNKLTINYEDADSIEKKALIIDGQHRLYGLDHFSPDSKIIVTAMLDISNIDQAFQFVVINNKSQGARPVDIKAVINAEPFKKPLRDRFIEVGIRYGNTATVLDYFSKHADSPFKDLLDWDLNLSNKRRIIQVQAIEDIYKYSLQKISDFQDEDSLAFSFISNLWRIIKDLYPNAWDKSVKTKNKESNLLMKATMISVSQWLIDEAKAAQKYTGFSFLDTDLENIKTEIIDKSLLSKLPEDFWIREWKGGLDTSAGRDMIKNSIEKVILNIEKGGEDDWDNKVSVFK